MLKFIKEVESFNFPSLFTKDHMYLIFYMSAISLNPSLNPGPESLPGVLEGVREHVGHSFSTVAFRVATLSIRALCSKIRSPNFGPNASRFWLDRFSLHFRKTWLGRAKKLITPAVVLNIASRRANQPFLFAPTLNIFQPIEMIFFGNYLSLFPFLASVAKSS